MKARFAWLVLVLALVSAFAVAPFSNVSAATKDKSFLKNVPVSGTLADGGSFKGQVSVTKFGYDQVNGLWVSGKIIGTATKADGTVFQNISQTFSSVDATLSDTDTSIAANSFQAQANCQILFLDLGPIFLDVLGLQVDLSRIVLDITAVSGAGNLLGNLLCAVVGLLDPNGLLTNLLDLSRLLDLLNQINQLLR